MSEETKEPKKELDVAFEFRCIKKQLHVIRKSIRDIKEIPEVKELHDMYRALHTKTVVLTEVTAVGRLQHHKPEDVMRRALQIIKHFDQSDDWWKSKEAWTLETWIRDLDMTA